MAGPAVGPEQIQDMVTTTQSHVNRKSWVDITSQYPTHVFADVMQDKSRHETLDGGFTWEHVVQVENNANARLSGMYDYDRTSQRSLNKTFTLNLAQIRTNFEYDVHESALNSGSSTRIINYVEQKMHSMEFKLVEFIETLGWSAPASATQDPKPLFGIPFWLQRGSAAAFNPYGGVDPSGFESAGRGGILSSETEHWANATWGYQSVNRLDFVKKMRHASKKCGFLTPKAAGYPNLIKEGGSDCVYYTTSENEEALEEMLEGKNDNFGYDLAKNQGKVLFKGNPVTSVDYLDDNTTDDPVFGVNWATMKFISPKGIFKDKSPIMVDPNRSTVRLQVFYTFVQLACLDLRRNFVGSRMPAA
jgi:hypothetical protein